MSLIERSMILPCKQSVHSREGIDSCEIHDLMREIGISKSAAKNLVFRLEEGSSSYNKSTAVHHLAIGSNWNGNRREFENAVNLSRIRSLSVFGKWKDFFISDKMRLLRVLDLEGTSGLADHHLEHIGKFLHLKYLSLRGCHGIYHLPASVGNLVRMETLDIKHTSIIKLPKAITRLRKLRYLRCGRLGVFGAGSYEAGEDMLKLARDRLSLLMFSSVRFCVACWAPQIMDDDMNRRDVCTVCCCNVFPLVARGLDPCSVVIPSGVNKLSELHTLGTVNIGRGKAIIQGIGSLKWLKKLRVAGVTRKNRREFFSALANLSNLESLLVRSVGMTGLDGCLDDYLTSAPAKSLQSLKLYGNLVKLPESVRELWDLSKLVLRSTRILEHEAAIEVLGKLPQLFSLRLLEKSFHGEDELRFTFHRGTFPSLKVLELNGIQGLRSVEFEEGAMDQLERLDFHGNRNEANAGTMFSGLASLPRLREFVLGNDNYKEGFVEDVRAQLAQNTSTPVLKR
ncbi:hypothetical protein PVAP13_6NG337200 [Panicum virgatum]|uniref:Disease resistance R13L4/SHOC-2-like LRR domain-containing protein n=1 Tax=Panicum virgatum TaxID=38727 RepID=A0A8T0R5F8_PANVG|nr:hypothetical protein PVAP13_6NG337200 [Panicum virgatum]